MSAENAHEARAAALTDEDYARVTRLEKAELEREMNLDMGAEVLEGKTVNEIKALGKSRTVFGKGRFSRPPPPGAPAPAPRPQVLGLPRSASAAEAKRAFTRLALLIHPDKCSQPGARDAFISALGAFRALSDSGARRRH
ncbi:hypothetical protein EMIHUDRAFT_109773 [Emiliania huxleyi CCMP1516]|uniref:J domain-containing protein n=2 Tax=Emiliania huxleyi TaxID=2903 RepID=A0A0D3KP42_EMIH1|nr:hypothetical protein EMIHUDRAFT_109773 [Emiliania huxleyi CCMP1516]EOD37527.1 hypothetical protein EMIHUDRAFT_109773 [Emiliania huxleyi CCMP1516]|eukprot:XP_005789956.1 hypothetical protein EMIHUDRAFT_109773 [Emiliania huxleyi CCMP1516]